MLELEICRLWCWGWLALTVRGRRGCADDNRVAVGGMPRTALAAGGRVKCAAFGEEGGEWSWGVGEVRDT